ncbi:MAG: flavodoxin [Clostridiales bacterium]|nr:flavodoxin [Clostridiales bacterium]
MMKAAVIYWSMTGNTEAMAQAVQKGLTDAGVETDLLQVSETDAASALGYDLLALGCPAMGSEQLEESEFEPFFSELEGSLSGRKVALFGSYAWAEGQWMLDWAERAEGAGALLATGQGLAVFETPDDEGTAQCEALGKALAAL